MGIDISGINQMESIIQKAFHNQKLSRAEFIAYAAAIANDCFDSAYSEECQTASDQIAALADFIKENCL